MLFFESGNLAVHGELPPPITKRASAWSLQSRLQGEPGLGLGVWCVQAHFWPARAESPIGPNSERAALAGSLRTEVQRQSEPCRQLPGMLVHSRKMRAVQVAQIVVSRRGMMSAIASDLLS